jgi:diguanylate cyclase
MTDKTPFEIARETLKQLTARKLAPTPMNYQRLYSEIAGLPMEPAFPADRLRDIATLCPPKRRGNSASAVCWSRPSTI